MKKSHEAMKSAFVLWCSCTHAIDCERVWNFRKLIQNAILNRKAIGTFDN